MRTPPPHLRPDESWTDERAAAKARHASLAAGRNGRRRMIDPTTCERDYSAAEMEFLKAIEAYKQSSGRMFPTWSEVLEVVRSLGYNKPGTWAASAPSAPASRPGRPPLEKSCPRGEKDL